MQNRSLCIGLLLIITGCVFQQVIPADNSTAPIAAVIKKTVTPLVIVGEGGPSGSLFEYAANTYVKEHGGIKYTVHDGDAFIDAMQEFRKKHGPIESFVYFGHGNEIGLYVNQELHVNGGLYASDPILHAKFRAASLYELPQTVFATGSTALFYGCNVARNEVGLDSFAEQFANHFQTQVKAATGPTEFSFEEDTRMQKRMPAKIADASLYMLPTFSDKGFVTIDPSPTGVGGYNDVYKSMEAADALSFFSKRGLRLGSESLFYPFQSIYQCERRKSILHDD